MTVSVIIPTHNYGRFLAEAIASVQAQSVEDLEIIVVDDGSTDDTPEVLARITDPRLRAVRVSNGGVSRARNIGLEMARGDYIAFLDADDRWHPDKLARQLELLAHEPEVGLVFTDFRRFDEHGYQDRSLFSYIPELRGIPTRPARSGEGRVITIDAFEALVGPRQLASWVQTVLVRREPIKDLRFPEGVHLNEDFYFMCQVYRRVGAAYLEAALVDVRRHGNNSYQHPAQMLRPKIEVLGMLEREALPSRQRRSVRRRLGIAWSALGYLRFWEGQRAEAALAYWRALAYPGCRLTAFTHLAAVPFAPLLARRRPQAGAGTTAKRQGASNA